MPGELVGVPGRVTPDPSARGRYALVQPRWRRLRDAQTWSEKNRGGRRSRKRSSGFDLDHSKAEAARQPHQPFGALAGIGRIQVKIAPRPDGWGTTLFACHVDFGRLVGQRTRSRFPYQTLGAT